MKYLISVILTFVFSNFSTPAFSQSDSHTAPCGTGRIVAIEDDVKWYPNDGSSAYQVVYLPPNNHHTVVGISACGSGVVTVFRDDRPDSDWAYYSPNCLNVGGGEETVRAYEGSNHKVISISPHPTEAGLLTTFQYQSDSGETGLKSTYHSPNCLNIGGGGNTRRVARGN